MIEKPYDPSEAASEESRALAPASLAAPIGTSAWRVATLTRVRELESLAAWEAGGETSGPSGRDNTLLTAVQVHLQAARSAAESRRLLNSFAGTAVERAVSNLDAAEAILLLLYNPRQLKGAWPEVLARVRQQLPLGDPRRRAMEDLARSRTSDLGERRGEIVTAYRGAKASELRSLLRIRSFRNVLLVTTTLLATLALGLAIVTAIWPNLIPLCFDLEATSTCPLGSSPSRWDYAVVEAAGLTAAAVSAASSLRNIHGTSTPYALPTAAAILKLPMGAITAVLGLILLRGNFIPGFGTLTTSGQIISWALVFGYAQILFTRLVDKQMNNILTADSPTADRTITPLIDEHFGQLRGELSGQLSHTVDRTLAESLRGPDLIAYQGFVSYEILTADGAPVTTNQAAHVLTPDTIYTLNVLFTSQSPPEGVSESVTTPGKPEGIAVFRVLPDSDWLTFVPGEREGPVAASAEPVRFSFEMRVPSRSMTTGMWITLYQHARLVHVVAVQLRISGVDR